jgi:Family of unknown function (DUF6510)
MEELDGNAAAGALSEVFALELTSARGRCEACGNVAALGEARAFVDAPGLVIRCRGCDAVLLVLVRAGRRYRLTVQGMTWIELDSS